MAADAEDPHKFYTVSAKGLVRAWDSSKKRVLWRAVLSELVGGWCPLYARLNVALAPQHQDGVPSCLGTAGGKHDLAVGTRAGVVLILASSGNATKRE